MQHFFHAFGHALEHSILDTLQMLPILLAVYLLMEYLEGKMEKWQHTAPYLHKIGPLAGALAGCIPQCGFSAAAASLYSKGFLSGGTLVAVFLSTSDEALPIMLANRSSWKEVAALIGVKVVLAVTAGYLLQATVFRREKNTALAAAPHTHTHTDSCCCTTKMRFRSPTANLIWRAVIRTLQVSGWIVVTILAVETVIHLIGEDQLNRLLLHGSVFQPLLTAGIGLIPGCAISVILTQLFIGGNIGFGAAVAGLATGAGVGYLVLAKESRDAKKTIRIIALTYLCAAITGIFLSWIVR